jgi:hypothetical protein
MGERDLDVDEIGRITSRDACGVGIGSDPTEWTQGYDDLMGSMRADAASGVNVGLDDVKAFSEGSVGWAAAHGYKSADRRPRPDRRRDGRAARHRPRTQPIG